MLRYQLVIHVWIASGFAFASDGCGYLTSLRHCELRSSEAIRN